jgi:hypothetical protein
MHALFTFKILMAQMCLTVYGSKRKKKEKKGTGHSCVAKGNRLLTVRCGKMGSEKWTKGTKGAKGSDPFAPFVPFVHFSTDMNLGYSYSTS